METATATVPVPMVRLLSIDAWREGSGWVWNNWHHVGQVPREWCHLTPRALLAKLRRECSRVPAQGYAAVEDDGYNVVVIHKNTGEPFIALAYGEAGDLH